MISVTECGGPVEISGIELDGNMAGHRFGGPWGDTGWQIGGNGMKLKNNRGPVILSNIHSHHHAQDGGVGDGPGIPGRRENVLVRDCRFISNGRNGWSLVGGVGWRFERCTFSKSARNLPFPGSGPKAGIDFEAEGGKFVGGGRLDVFGHFRGTGTRFVTDPGGTDFLATPAGKGHYFAGAAEDSFSVTMRNGTTRTYPPTTSSRRAG